MTIESGKFKAFVGFTEFPLKTTIVYRDSLKLEILSSDLRSLRTVIDRAIEKTKQLAPSDEDREETRRHREYLARVKSITATTVAQRMRG
jgi:hypothetical protein